MIKKFLLGTGLLALSATTLAGQAWLFRHAETAPEDEPNPHLSEAGLERATKLADMVGKIDRVYATEYRRTQQTAAILADMNGLPIVPYDPSDMAGLAAEVRAFEGTVAIAGHSNTTPVLVHLLGGNPQSAIDSHEYDRVYHLHWDNAQSPVTTTLLFSEPRWLDSDLKLTGFPLKPASLSEYSLTFNMLLRGIVAGTATWSREKTASGWQIAEQTVLNPEYRTDAQITIQLAADHTYHYAASGTMFGQGMSIDLNFSETAVNGTSDMARLPFFPQGEMAIDQPLTSAAVERATAIMLADIALEQAPFAFQWFNPYNGQMRRVEATNLGNETVTVPAGTFETEKLLYKGGAPSQIFYVTKSTPKHIVAIDVVDMPWRYELQKSPVDRADGTGDTTAK